MPGDALLPPPSFFFAPEELREVFKLVKPGPNKDDGNTSFSLQFLI
jgi:hypothetical protein